jgi:hypothetical protein
MLRNPFSAIATLGVFGIILIWKGITNDVMMTPMGDAIIPRWMYVIGGMILIIFPLAFFFVSSETGRTWLGL